MSVCYHERAEVSVLDRACSGCGGSSAYLLRDALPISPVSATRHGYGNGLRSLFGVLGVCVGRRIIFILGFSAAVHLILLGAISFVGRQRTFWVLVTVFAVLLLLDIGGCSIVGSSLKHCW